jgi:pilus assembly protein CpaE
LLDLGLPAGDGQLYLNASGSFHFADVVRSRHRLDQTLIQTALTRSRSGIKIISIPRSAHQISGLAAADIVAVLALLRSYFDVLVMDLGGFADPALACKMAATADQTWLLTDQSAGSLVSLAALIAELDLHASVTATPPRQLIVNRYNKQYGMSAEQIAERFQLNLAAAIPDRTASLMSSANQGKLLHEIVGSDSYLHALETLVEKTLGSVVKINGAGTLSRWLSGVLFR